MEIVIRNLNKKYGKQEALKNISLQIPVGLYGLLGENGAGKTTLMRILAAALEPTAGTVKIDGIDIKQKKQIRKMTGYLPQEFSVYPNMSVSSALDYLGILSELPKEERKNRIDEVLRQVNLEQERKKRFKNLSGGMKRRFGIAQALLNHPKVLIIDEPTAGLDPEERLRLYNLLTELASERVILLSTHIAGDIAPVCERTAVFHEGRVIFEGDTKALLKIAENKVYTAIVQPSELEDLKRRYHVIRIHQSGNHISCRFFADEYPKVPCIPSESDIEDSYMYLLWKYRREVE